MAKTRVFTNLGTGSQTGVYHVVSRFDEAQATQKQGYPSLLH